MKEILDKAKQWLTSTFDTETQQEIKQLIKNNPELTDRFYKDTEFGTGGMSGIMGEEPTESINIHSVELHRTF